MSRKKKVDVIAALKAIPVEFAEDANYHDLCKILKEQTVSEETTTQTGSSSSQVGGGPDVVESKAEKMLAEANEKLNEANKKLAEAKAPKGIKSIRKPGEKLKRPDDVMNEDLKSIGTSAPAALTENQRIALERQIRKHVKSGTVMTKGVAGRVKGGWRKGVSEDNKRKTKIFLERIGRPLKDGQEPAWDESIIVPGMQW